MTAARHFDDTSLAACPFADAGVALVGVDRETGEVVYASNPDGKLELAAPKHEGRWTLLLAWPGRWRQDVFVMDDQALTALRRACLKARR